MSHNLSLLWFFVLIHSVWGFYNVCRAPKNNVLNDEECSELYFDQNEKTSNLGRIQLQFEKNSFMVTPVASAWTNTFLRITMRNNNTNRFCSKLIRDSPPNSFCLIFGSEMENETFLLEYKIEKLPEISSRKIVFTVPNFKEAPIFLYVDQTDTSHLILNGQKLPSSNATLYEIKAYKEKNGNTNLQDFRLFSSSDKIQYELFTYNDVGNYYFVVSVMGDNCTDNICFKITTPKIFIGRKSTRVVIGIVGASFILPFVLFIFHILTKKYPNQDTESELQEHLMVAYKSSFKKHNEVVNILANLLKKLCKNQIIDIVDLAKTPKKFCVDSVFLAHRVIYIAPPKIDDNPILIGKSMAEKEFYCILFDYTVEKLPQFFDDQKKFKLFEDWGRFMAALGLEDVGMCEELRKKTEEAKIETDQAEVLPKIVVTDLEPQENDSLITKVL